MREVTEASVLPPHASISHIFMGEGENGFLDECWGGAEFQSEECRNELIH